MMMMMMMNIPRYLRSKRYNSVDYKHTPAVLQDIIIVIIIYTHIVCSKYTYCPDASSQVSLLMVVSKPHTILTSISRNVPSTTAFICPLTLPTLS